MEPSDWPAPIRTYLRSTLGEPLGIEAANGMSGADVWRANYAGGSVIVKSSARETESRFYEQVAPQLQAGGVAMPSLQYSLHERERHWIVIEALPHLLSGSAADHAPDADLLGMLARLHAVTRDGSFDLPTVGGAYSWREETTAAALTWFEERQRAALKSRLTLLQAEGQRLWQPWCWISGDPSPANWGRREDGSLALFDWELFRLGLPAIDIAITVSGLAGKEAFQAAALLYRRQWSETASEELPWSLDEMVEDMTLAKLWTAVAMLAAQAQGSARVPSIYIERLVAQLPGWIDASGL